MKLFKNEDITQEQLGPIKPSENENISKEQEVKDQSTKNDLKGAIQPFWCTCRTEFISSSARSNHIKREKDETKHKTIPRANNTKGGRPKTLTKDQYNILQLNWNEKPLDENNTPKTVGKILEKF